MPRLLPLLALLLWLPAPGLAEEHPGEDEQPEEETGMIFHIEDLDGFGSGALKMPPDPSLEQQIREGARRAQEDDSPVLLAPDPNQEDDTADAPEQDMTADDVQLESLEWQMGQADVAVRARVDTVIQAGEKYDVARLDVREMFKSDRVADDPPDAEDNRRWISVAFPRTNETSIARIWQDENVDVLVVLKACDPDMPARYELYSNSRPQPSAYRLDDAPAVGAFSGDMSLLTRGKDILERARKIAASPPPAGAPLDLEVLWDSDIFDAVWRGGLVRLRVPPLPQYEATALRMIKSPTLARRVRGIERLAHFRSDANIARLRALLADDDFVVLRKKNGDPAKRLYTTRRAAYDALKSWGVSVARPVLEERIDTADEPPDAPELEALTLPGLDDL